MTSMRVSDGGSKRALREVRSAEQRPTRRFWGVGSENPASKTAHRFGAGEAVKKFP